MFLFLSPGLSLESKPHKMSDEVFQSHLVASFCLFCRFLLDVYLLFGSSLVGFWL